MVYERLPWQDRFRQPSTKELRKALPTDASSLFDTARDHLSHLSDVKEETVWYGESWRWSIEYRTPRSNEPLAVLIPSPEDLQLAMPLEASFISSLPMNRLKRAVRDGLDLAQEPFDTNWGVWSIHPTVVDDLKDLVNRKLKYEISNS